MSHGTDGQHRVRAPRLLRTLVGNIYPSFIMNAGSIVLLFVVPVLIIALAVVLFMTTKEADE